MRKLILILTLVQMFVATGQTTISAVTASSFLYDCREHDGAFNSSEKKTTILKDIDHTTQAFFKSSSALPLPFFEDFTDVAIGGIPADWDRTHANWGAASSNYAHGVKPEMQLEDYLWATGQNKVITPRLDGATATQITCSFKYYVESWYGSFTICVQTSINGGATWEDRWLQTTSDIYNSEAFVNLDAVAGEEFMVAFVFESKWDYAGLFCIDDVAIYESRELNMLNPVNRGAVAPVVGSYSIPVGQDVTLGALPSSTWYAIESVRGFSFSFDPTTLGLYKYLAVKPDGVGSIGSGAWADGVWYVVDQTTPSNLYTVSPSTGDITRVGPAGTNIKISGITYDNVNGILYGSSATSLYTIDKSTGTATFIGDYSDEVHLIDIAYGNGTMYGYCATADGIYTIDIDTTLTTKIDSIDFGDFSARSMEYDKDHNRLFLLGYNHTDFDCHLVEVDLVPLLVVDWGVNERFYLSRIDGLAIPYGMSYPWEFDRWEIDGTACSTDPILTLTMNDNHAAQAFFTTTRPTHTLTMLTPGGKGTGTVTPSIGTHLYAENTTAYLLATSDYSFSLDYWEVDGAFYTDNQMMTVTMDTDHSVQAFFTDAIYLRMLEPGGNGKGSVSPQAGITYCTKGSTIRISAAADLGSKLDYWEVDGAYFSTNHDEDIVMDDNHTAQAFFAFNPDHFCSPGDQFAQLVDVFFVAPCSDAYSGVFAADDFFGLTEPIYGVDFWGGEVNPEATDSFVCTRPSLDYIVRFYEYGPLPGKLLHEEIITVTRIETSFHFYCGYLQGPLHKYTGTLAAPVTLANGWFSVQAVDSGPCLFYWVGSDLKGSDYDPAQWDGEWRHLGEYVNLAFCLLGEPTPEYPLGVRLKMPDMAHPGDEFSIIGHLDNPEKPLSQVATFFILEVYGKFWFWPSWAYFDYPDYQGIDYRCIDVLIGTTSITVIPPFDWPDTGQDVVTGLGFYGAMLNPEMNDIMGEIAYQEWGYGPSR